MAKWKKRNQKKKQDELLAEGIVLKTDAFAQKENRAFTLLLKGVLVYLIVMGGMGCFLSALDIQYAWWIVHLVLFLTAVFCAMLYYNTRWENIGYLLLLGIMFFTGNGLRNYINSGFYAVANDMADQASGFFDSNAMRSFGEQVSNRYLAITISMCYVGCVCCIFMNILISRRMQYVAAIPLCMGVLLMPLYLELEPDLIYVVMLVSGLLAAYVVRGNGHYRLSQENTCYQFQAKTKQISYVHAGKTLTCTVAVIFLFCFIVIQLTGMLYPRKRFQENHTMSAVKAQTMDTVENLSLLGIMGLFNFYPNTGGLTNGTLGGVSAVRFDYEPDLVLEFVPYTDERMYFKTFTGAHYLPYSNRWSRQENEDGVPVAGEVVDQTTLQMIAAYESGNKKSAKGTVKITNQAAATGVYLPYYSKEVDQVVYPGETVEYTFYPKVSGESILVSGKKQKRQTEGGLLEDSMEEWLEVPEENRETIAMFCEMAGLQGNVQTLQDGTMAVVQQLAEYYQKNIPYTYRPGLTPGNKDFVNYFLMENKRGYCAHFASAATLIFRYLGIPARYVEGYAIDPQDISEEGKILKDQKFSQYYTGYSPMGETGVVSVNATDAHAHAWVEIYDQDQGWQVVEITPASDEEESSDSSIWRRLMNFFNGGQGNQAAQDTGEEENKAAIDESTRQVSGRAALVVAVLFVLAIVGQWSVRRAMKWYRYCRAGRNEKLIMRYQSYIHRLSRRQKELAGLVNYRQQLQWLKEKNFWKMGREEQEACASILERAGFSDQEISEREFDHIVKKLRNVIR